MRYCAPLCSARSEASAHGIVDVLRSIFLRFDQKFAEFCGRVGQPPVTCKQGCAACCYLYVTASVPEAILMIVEAKKLGYVIDWKRVEKQAREITSLDMTTKKWFATQQPCVFLTDKNECGIYAARPMACRSCAVISNPERCQLESKEHVIFINNTEAVRLIRDRSIRLAKIAKFRSMGAGSLPRSLLLAKLFLEKGTASLNQELDRLGMDTEEKCLFRELHMVAGSGQRTQLIDPLDFL